MVSGGTVASINVSGAFFDPVIPTAIYFIAGYSDSSALWLYWAGPLIGAVVAPLLFVFMAPHEFVLVSAAMWRSAMTGDSPLAVAAPGWLTCVCGSGCRTCVV